MLIKTRNTLVIAVTIMLTIEIVLQIRSHIRYGQSVFNILSNQTTYVIDKNTGLKVLQPNQRIEGSQAILDTNAYGLRDEPLTGRKPHDEYRIAVVGASTVMGTYTRNNQDTLSYRIQEVLRGQPGDRSIRVINAGIAGYSLNDQRHMVERLLSQMSIDHYILYTGFNDLTEYCHTGNSSETGRDFSLPELELPSWLLTTELITKNTVPLRTPVARLQSLIDPQSVDSSTFRNNLHKLIGELKATRRPVLVVGNARAFRRHMSFEQQEELSETARYYKSCFDTDGLHTLFDDHNRIIQQAADDYGLPYFNLQDELPGGSEFFGDATHFSVAGTRRAAVIITEYLKSDLLDIELER